MIVRRYRRAAVELRRRGAQRSRDWLCDDCGMQTAPCEVYMVRDEVWAEAHGRGYLCIGCLENRLGRELVPDDFPPLPVNDDEECDTVRLRIAKGSGRNVTGLYQLATVAVVDLGVTAELAASALRLDPRLVRHWVDGERRGARGRRADHENET